MNNRPSFLKDVTIFSKYMNIKASHMGDLSFEQDGHEVTVGIMLQIA